MNHFKTLILSGLYALSFSAESYAVRFPEPRSISPEDFRNQFCDQLCDPNNIQNELDRLHDEFNRACSGQEFHWPQPTCGSLQDAILAQGQIAQNCKAQEAGYEIPVHQQDGYCFGFVGDVRAAQEAF
jgi:hypothetical protein